MDFGVQDRLMRWSGQRQSQIAGGFRTAVAFPARLKSKSSFLPVFPLSIITFSSFFMLRSMPETQTVCARKSKSGCPSSRESVTASRRFNQEPMSIPEVNS